MTACSNRAPMAPKPSAACRSRASSPRNRPSARSRHGSAHRCWGVVTRTSAIRSAASASPACGPQVGGQRPHVGGVAQGRHRPGEPGDRRLADVGVAIELGHGVVAPPLVQGEAHHDEGADDVVLVEGDLVAELHPPVAGVVVAEQPVDHGHQIGRRRHPPGGRTADPLHAGAHELAMGHRFGEPAGQAVARRPAPVAAGGGRRRPSGGARPIRRRRWRRRGRPGRGARRRPCGGCRSARRRHAGS